MYALEIYKKREAEAKSHVESLRKKYGDQAVSSLKYKDVKLKKNSNAPELLNIVNERTVNTSDVARSIVSTAASYGISATLNLPVFMLFTPSGASNKGKYVADQL